MTDRVRTLIVELEQDTRTDDADEIKGAIRFIRGVARVENGNVVDMQVHMERDTVWREFSRDLMEFMRTWKSKRKL